MALTQDSNRPRRDGEEYEYPVASNVVCYAGGIAVMQDGSVSVRPATTENNLRAVGVFAARADNSGGGPGDIRAKVRRGVFRFHNAGGSDGITLASVGYECFIVDDETVARTVGSGTRSVAGVVRDVDDQGVWVQI